MKRTFLFMVSYWVALNCQAQCNCGGSSSSIAFSDAGNASITMKKNQWMVELSGEYRKFNQKHSAHDHDGHDHVHSVSTSSESSLKNTLIGLIGLRYGVTDRITLSLQQPYLSIYASPKGTDGIGDLLFVANVKLIAKSKFSAGIMLGAELPTGIASGLAGENNSVIGSGSFDPVAGISVLKTQQKSFIRLNVFYKQGTIGYNKTNFGSFLNGNLTFSYKIKSSNSFCSTDSIKSNKLELSLFSSISNEWYTPQISDHVINQNSGGHLFLAGGGAQFGYKTWSIPISFQIPIFQNLKGEQSQTEFRVKIGIIKSFN
ncbi:MAG: hypothetical protein ACK50A_11325 [Sphingobacteriaceae bacterium]|jgi:hypothetical protein